MSVTRPEKPDPSRILSTDPSLAGLVRADPRGNVLETAGEVDAEAAGAVVAMATRHIADAASEAGLGQPMAWHASVGSAAWYVVRCQEELLAVVGRANKSPHATLKSIAKDLGARP